MANHKKNYIRVFIPFVPELSFYTVELSFHRVNWLYVGQGEDNLAEKSSPISQFFLKTWTNKHIIHHPRDKIVLRV